MKKFISTQFPFTLLKIRTKASFVLYLAMFIMGACGLAYEYTLSKVASDLLGDSVRQWAITIGVMMFFMGVGSDVQKYLSNKNLLDKFITIEILLGILGAFGPILILYTYGKFPAYYIIVQYFFITSIGFIIGFEIPLITRINQAYTSELKLNLAGVLKMDYIGSLAGSMAWIFLLPKMFTLIQSAFVLGLLNLLVAAFALYYFRKLMPKRLTIALFLSAAFIATLIGYFSSNKWTLYAEQYLYRDRIVFSHTTIYQHIVLTESKASDVSCYINGRLQFNSYDEFIYHENLVHPAFVIAPYHKNILILGGGDGLALREVLKYPDVKTVTLCDIDPMMTKLARESSYFCTLNNNSLANSKLTVLKNHALIPSGSQIISMDEVEKEVKIINIDAIKFVEQISGVFDIIILDFPDPNCLELSKLYSKQFYQNVIKKLAAFGIVVQQSTSPFHAKEVFLCIGRTMKDAGLEVVPYHDNVPSFGEWGWWVGGNANQYSNESIKEKMRTITEINVPTRYLTPAMISASLEFGKNQLIPHNEEIINTMVNNKISELYLQAWKRTGE